MGSMVMQKAVQAQVSGSRAHSVAPKIKFKFIVSLCFIGSILGLSQQSWALPAETEAGIKQFVMKSPSVFGLKTEIEFLEPGMGIASCPVSYTHLTLPTKRIV